LLAASCSGESKRSRSWTTTAGAAATKPRLGHRARLLLQAFMCRWLVTEAWLLGIHVVHM
jgi:hypothetical protein